VVPGGLFSLSNDWTPTRRVAFRFGVVYLTLFGLATQISGSLIANPWFAYRGMGRLWPMREITHSVGLTVFGISVPLDDVSGGETLFFWIQWFWLIAASVTIAAIWTLASTRRSYATWLPGIRLAVRLVLAASLLEYGMTKVIPTQFPAPPLTALVTPVGEMTLSALLWTTIGSAPAYQIITGCVEVLAGVLLILPWTVTLGALLGLLALLQVLLLNLTFDIGVKLVTTHLIVLAVILLAPAARQLAVGVGFRAGKDAAAGDAAPRPLFTSPRAISGQLLFAAYLLGVLTYVNLGFWQVAGGGRPKSMLYGIWNVERLLVDGQDRPPAMNDYDRRWRRVIFDAPDELVVQRTDDSFARYGVSFDRERGSMTLSKSGGRTWTTRFTFDRTGDDRLTLEGEMDGQRVEALLTLMDSSAFPLLNSSFRWIRPHDP
jgi:hypothetical protein